MTMASAEGEGVKCTICAESHPCDRCPLVVGAIRIKDCPTIPRAKLTLPKELQLLRKTSINAEKLSVGHDVVVAAKSKIPAGIQFGPVEAPRVEQFNAGCPYRLKVFGTNGNDSYLDTSSENFCNWMTYVAYSQDKQCVSCYCYQLENDIYFTTIKDLEPGDLLVVGYATGYGEKITKDWSQSMVDQNCLNPIRTLPANKTYGAAAKRLRSDVEFTQPGPDHDYTVDNRLDVQMALEVASIVDIDFTDVTPEEFSELDRTVQELTNQQMQTVEIKGAKNKVQYPVLAVSEWKCKFCDFQDTEMSKFAEHLVEHYKSVGSAKTEKLRIQRNRYDPNNSADQFPLMGENDIDIDNYEVVFTAVEDGVSQSQDSPHEAVLTADIQRSSVIQPKYPYTCDICVRKKIFNRAEYIIRHLRYHLQTEDGPEDMNVACLPDGTVIQTKKEKIPFPCTECSAQFDQERDFHSHMKKNHTKVFQCGTCSQDFADENQYDQHKCSMGTTIDAGSLMTNSLQAHMNLYTDPRLEEYVDAAVCRVCGKVVQSCLLHTHQALCDAMTLYASETKEYILCPTCSRVCNSLDDFRAHSALHTHPGMCPVCYLRLPVTETLKSHTCKKFQCDGCETVVDTYRQFKRHIAQRHGYVEYYCFECAMPFVTRRGLDEHSTCQPPKKPESERQSQRRGNPIFRETVVQGEKQYVCVICKATYTKQTSLRTHMSVHQPKKFKCSQCSKQFHRKQLQVEHELRHGEAKFACNECDKKFTTKKSLIVHQHIHSGNKRFMCNLCNKAFVQKINLLHHLATHLPKVDKEQECPLCSKKFSSRDYLKFHLEEHQYGRNEVCHICNQRFVKKYQLKHHLKVKHGGIKYVCEFCPVSLSSKHSLHRHLTSKHGALKNRWDQPDYVNTRVRQKQDFDDVNGDLSDSISIALAGADIDLDGNSYEIVQEDIQKSDVQTSEASGSNINEESRNEVVFVEVDEGGEIVLSLTGKLDCSMEGAVELIDEIGTLQLTSLSHD